MEGEESMFDELREALGGDDLDEEAARQLNAALLESMRDYNQNGEEEKHDDVD